MPTITPLGSALGATIEDIAFDGDALPDDDAAAIKQAWIDFGVVFFPELNPTPEQQLAVANALGAPEAHGDYGDDTRDYGRVGGHRELIELDNALSNRADFWHTDATFRPEPPAGSILCLREVPPQGGDTMWSSTAAAYDALPDPIKAMVDQLTATHGRPPMTGTSDHPVVAVHPQSGRRALYVNRGWTASIVGMPHKVGQQVLDLLFGFIEQPEFAIRWTWTPGDLAAWDNRTTQHYAVHDYGDYPRMGHRAIVAGERPVGIS